MSFEYSHKNKTEVTHRATLQGQVFSLGTYLNKYSIDYINDQGDSKWAVLIAGCFYKQENIVRMLLRSFKPNVNAIGDFKLDFVDEIMCVVTALWVAVGDISIVKLLIEEGNGNLNQLTCDT